jgi:hypothetical protein
LLVYPPFIQKPYYTLMLFRWPTLVVILAGFATFSYPVSQRPICTPTTLHLSDALQFESVPRNLIIDLIRLACNPFNMLILLVYFLAHSATELVQTLGHGV